MSNYEKLRLKNLEDNRRILSEIGLVNPYTKFPKVNLKKGGLKRKAESQISKAPKKQIVEDLEGCGSLRGERRRSARIGGKPALTGEEIEKEKEKWEEDEDYKPIVRVPANRPNFYGAVSDVEVGTMWITRMECCRDGIHRPTVAGIHGGPDGAYSIALSGGYEDDIDLGECFTYTGEGGRDLKGTKNNPKNLRTAPQSKDQSLSRGNLALSRNVDTGNPVRVIRGYKLHSAFAPEEGYRYDGLYTVEKAWFTSGLSGFGVWKFALRRCKDQAPPPWDYIDGDENSQPKMTNGEAVSDENKKKKTVKGESQPIENSEENRVEVSDEIPQPKTGNEESRSSEDSDKIQDCTDIGDVKGKLCDESSDNQKPIANEMGDKVDENKNICLDSEQKNSTEETSELCGR